MTTAQRDERPESPSETSTTSPPTPRSTDRRRPPERLWRELVGEQLRGIRQSRGDTLRDVAERARVSPQYLSEIERGFKEPSSEILAALAESLDSSLLDLTASIARGLHRSSARTGIRSRNDVALAA